MKTIRENHDDAVTEKFCKSENLDDKAKGKVCKAAKKE